MTSRHSRRSQPRVPGTVAEVMGSPEGPEIAAFFDLDGTIVAGFTVTVYTKTKIRRGDFGVSEIYRILATAYAFQMGRSTFQDFAEAGLSTLAGKSLAGSVPFGSLFDKAGARYGVSPALLSAVARQESGYDPSAVSPAGAQGLMQLMPATARGLGVSDSFNPAQAVDGAARLLHDLIDRFGRTDLALAAYNAGPGAVLRYDGIPPYPETQNYVRSVMAMIGGSA